MSSSVISFISIHYVTSMHMDSRYGPHFAFVQADGLAISNGITG